MLVEVWVGEQVVVLEEELVVEGVQVEVRVAVVVLEAALVVVLEAALVVDFKPKVKIYSL